MQTAIRQQKSVAVARQNKASNWPWIGAIVLYAIFNALIIGPQGNFPLNDDWVYGHGVKTLLEFGRIELPSSFSTAFVHVGLGALVTKIFGFSYTPLHWLTATMGLIASLALYLALVEVGVRRSYAGFASLMYASNPLIVNLCYSFMSDMPSFAFTNLYLLFLFRGIRRDSKANLAVSALMLLLAIGVRQGSLLFVVSNMSLFALALMRRKNPLPIFALLIILPICFTFGLESTLEHTATKCQEYTVFKQAHLNFVHDMLHVPAYWAFTALVAFGQISTYMAVFCLPLMPSLIRGFIRLFTKRLTFMPVVYGGAAAVVSTTLTKLVVENGKLMPFNENMLRIPEIGAHNLMGISIAGLPRSVRFWFTQVSACSNFVFLVVLASAFASALTVIWKAFVERASTNVDKSLKQRRASLVAFCFVSLALCLMCVTMETVVMDADRHYLIALAPLIICLAISTRWLRLPAPGIVSYVLLAAVAAYSTMATQDYMNWNRARWQAIEMLRAFGVKDSQIDGGAEHVFANNPDLALKTWRNDLRKSQRDYWRWWRVDDDLYIISFSTIPGYQEIGRQHYFSPLSWSNRPIYVLMRAESDEKFVDPRSLAKGGAHGK